MPVVLPVRYSNPNFELRIAGQSLSSDFGRPITSAEYESADGLADVGKFTVINPNGVLTDSKMFQAGNEVDFFFGYDTLEHVGRVQLVKPKFSFPSEDHPSISLTGYTLDHRMADHSPPKPQKSASATKKRGRVWKAPVLISDILESMSEEYGFSVDADAYEFTSSVAQKPGMSDYDFVKGLSNLTGAFFWVDYNPNDGWVCHFRLPDDVEQGQVIEQDAQYTLTYNQGNESTLFSFEPEYALRDAVTKLSVEYTDSKGAQRSAEFEDDLNKSPDLESLGDPSDTATDPLFSGGSIKLYFGENSVELVPNKTFAKPAELLSWTRQWFRRNRENFVHGKGTCIGIEKIKARQIHNINGVGQLLSGKYYFSRVRHHASDSGYMLDFDCRKVLV